MNTIPRTVETTQAVYGSAFAQSLSAESLQHTAPAVFAPRAHERLTAAYTFVPTGRVLDAIAEVGFFPVEARQSRTRTASPLHARHLIRLRRRLETVALREAVPELLLLNSHDGTSAYQLRVGLYRAVCTNGLVVSVGVMPAWRVLHRGSVVDEVVRGALEMSERFGVLATQVERMERTILDEGQRLAFATEAQALRFPNDRPGAVTPADLLRPLRSEDVGNDLWHVLNVLQEALLQGGVLRRSARNRLTHTRRITAIQAGLRLNSALWDLALARMA
jgi:hypothetical protein